MKIPIYISIFFISLFYPNQHWANGTANMLPTTTTSSPVVAPPACAGAQATLQWLRYDNIPGWSIDYLYNHPYFPQAPDAIKTLSSLQTPLNYDEYFGSLVRGYIVPPVTGNYTFNLTGDEFGAFYLSTTEFVSDTVHICNLPSATWLDGHDNSPEHTSSVISLTAGNYYYFELHHKESGYSDHAQVYWQAPFTNGQWQVIQGSYLYDYVYGQGCENLCPVAGTPCSDENPDTINDAEDGFCNCVGQVVTANDCVGDRNSVVAFYFDDVPGWSISDLTSSQAYINNTPSRAEFLPTLSGPLTSEDLNYYGTKVTGFLAPPITGTYRFNVTADDMMQLFLRTDDNPNNASMAATALYYTGIYDHDNHQEQTSIDITLNAGQYYYFEILHKEGEYGDRFNAFWQTPFSPNKWLEITGAFIYQNNCEMGCIPNGTVCDDGNANTENDVYTNCNCAGTPCLSEGCTPTGGAYNDYDFCAPTNEHSNNSKDTWLSCSTSPNPNPTRGNTHWIQYDFGELKTITTSHVWNYNAAGDTGKGFRSVVIDYSTDGTNWTHFGTYQWAQAPGTNGYTGFAGPNFNNLMAQYILVTGLTNWESSNCRGLSEMNFTVQAAALPLELLSFNAVPEKEAIHLHWEVANEQNLKGYTLQRSSNERDFKPMAWVEASKQNNPSYTHKDAQVRPNQWYYYRLKMVEEDNRVSYSDVKAARLKADGTMEIYPNPTHGDMTILMTTTQAETVMIEVYSLNGQQIKGLSVNVQEGLTRQVIDLEGVSAGTYWVKVYGTVLNMTRRVVVF